MLQRGAVYVRVSTDDQVEYSPDAQLKALKEYAKKNHILIHDKNIFVDEGYSGRKAEKRPAFMEMIKLAKKKPKEFDVILVHKYDRFARSREDSVVYKSLLRKECGIRVVSITEQIEDDKFSIILESMLEAMAEYYSLNLADEVKKGLTEKAKRGQYTGGTLPFGYKTPIDGKTLLVDEEKRKTIEIIFNKFVIEDCALVEVARYLNTLGYKTQNNTSFTKRSIKYILQNPVYCGYNRWNYRKGNTNTPNPPEEWIIEKGAHESIVSKELYDKAQIKLEQLSRNFRKKARPSSEYKHWLSSILRCASCNSSMTAYNNNGYIHYRCSKAMKGGCTTPNYISSNKVENIVLNQILHDSQNVYSRLFERIHMTPKNHDLELLESHLHKVQKKYDLATEAFLAEIDSLMEYKEKKQRIKKEEEEILSQIQRIKKETHEQNSKEYIQNIFITGYNLLRSNDLNLFQKNKIAKSFIKAITINSKEKILHINYHIDEYPF